MRCRLARCGVTAGWLATACAVGTGDDQFTYTWSAGLDDAGGGGTTSSVDDTPETGGTSDGGADGPDTDCDEVDWFADADADGHGDPHDGLSACHQPPGYVDVADDCDDDDGAQYPGAAEICDDRDNDCDGLIDNGASCVEGCTIITLTNAPGWVLALCAANLTNDEARAACQAQGGDLATLEKPAVALELIAGAPAVAQWPGWRIGLGDDASEGTFVWITGAELSFSMWGQSQPDQSGGDEDCVEVLFPDGIWNDVACAQPRPYICELPA